MAENKHVASTLPTDKEGGDQLKPVENDQGTASFEEMFSNAEPIDYFNMFVGTLGGIITGLSLPAFNILFGKMLNTLNGSTTSFSTSIDSLCIAFVIIAVFNLFSGFAQVYCWSWTGERQAQKFREKYVNAILSQEIGWFDTCGAGELATRVAELTGKIQDGMGRKVGDLIQYIAQIIASFVVAFYLCWQLTVVLIASFPVIAGAGAFMINAITAAQNQSLGQYAAAGGLATESLGAIRTVSALNAQSDVITRYRIFLFKAMQVGITKGFNVGLGNGALFCACFFTYALGFWYGGKLVADSIEGGCSGNSCLSGGTILSVFFCTIMGSMALGQMAPPLMAFTTAKAAIRTLLDVVNRVPLIDGLSSAGEKPCVHTKGTIEIKDVNFFYPSRPNITVCRDYNLHIEPGETIALVGVSGCGKSTIINLLLRFYDPQDGVITLDGHDIKNLNIRWLRSQIGYVGQEPILFAGTIADNISYGLEPELLGNTAETLHSENKLSPEDLRARIIAATKLANAHDFISDFPQGYDTDVGSNGVAMSGGQKQRIAIARALIKKPSVLLLDEATSALDATSERVVQQSIDALQKMKTQTTIVIAHRLSTIRNADKICLIDQGRIAEMGTHDELIAKNGLYADLVRLQMSSHDDNNDSDDEQNYDEKNDAEMVEDGQVVALSGVVDHRHRKRTISNGIDDEHYQQEKKLSSRKHSDSGDATAGAAAGVVVEELSKEEAGRISSRIWAMVRMHAGWLFVACLSAAVFGGVFPSWGLMLAYSQNMFYLSDPEEIKQKAALYAYLYIMLGGVSLFSATFQFWGVAQVAERVSINLRSQMFEALMRRDISFFDQEVNSIGTLTTRLSDDSRIVNKAFGDSLARQLQAFFCLAIALILGLRASWKVSLVVIAAFPINIIASSIQMQATMGQQYESEEQTNIRDETAAMRKAASTRPSTTTTTSGAANTVAKTESGSSVVSGGHGAIISTAFTHMRTVSAFSMQHKVSEHYAKITNDQAVQRAKRSLIAGFGFGGSQCALFLTYALLFWYGASLIQKGEISFLQLMSAILTLMLGALGLGTALADIGDQKAGIQTADRIFKAIDEGAQSPIDGLSTTGIIPSTRALGRIELKAVNFVYPTRPNVQVCKNFTLTIEPGEMVAFVGPSGSGKSTIINLLLRFYDPVSGSVSIDGHDIKSVNVRWLRSQIGFVGQEPVLFTGTVAENIAKGRVDSLETPVASLAEAMKISDEKEAEGKNWFGCLQKKVYKELTDSNNNNNNDDDDDNVGEIDPEKGCSSHMTHQQVAVIGDDATDIEMGCLPASTQQQQQRCVVEQDIRDACIASNAHDFITSFPQGYDTDIGEGSIMVSGGQKQRIAIARALIKKPSVLLLDEATSALDATSERVVQQSIDALQKMKAQTTIVIAHRLSTIRNADKIMVIDKGVVVEIGKHEELITKNGLYSQLWAKQSGTS